MDRAGLSTARKVPASSLGRRRRTLPRLSAAIAEMQPHAGETQQIAHDPRPQWVGAMMDCEEQQGMASINANTWMGSGCSSRVPFRLVVLPNGYRTGSLRLREPLREATPSGSRQAGGVVADGGRAVRLRAGSRAVGSRKPRRALTRIIEDQQPPSRRDARSLPRTARSSNRSERHYAHQRRRHRRIARARPVTSRA